mgnify:CR=1 FL=1
MQWNHKQDNPLQENTRPVGVILVFSTLILFSFFQILKLSRVIIRWDILSSLSLSIPPLLQAGEGLVWALSGLLLAWSTWKRKTWAPAGIQIASLIFTLLSWIKLWLFATPDLLQNRWPVNLVLTVIGLGALLGTLNLRSTRSYFGINTAKIP